MFLAAGVAVAAGAVVGCGSGGSSAPVDGVPDVTDPTKAWQLSTRGVSGASNAAKSHAANKRFVSAAAASANRAHAGDRSRIVPIDITPATWQAWFGSGAVVADLRRL